jgi:hypothetical protein
MDNTTIPYPNRPDSALKLSSSDHYRKGKIECLDAMESAVTGLEGMEAVHTANIIKYIWRWKHKGQAMPDLLKAKDYLSRLIELVGENEKR